MTEKLFKRLDYGFGWLAFLVAAIVYMMTLEPTVSFWDCGEFISSSNKLQVGHPPGAPFFMLIARFFAMFANGPEQVALMINAFSGIVSAFTIMFLYWSIAYFAKRMIAPDGNYNLGKTIAIIAASMVGALVYTFSDTFWFSAVEGEVYAFSSFFTAIVFWAILKWSDSNDEKYAARWILLIALLVGMSIGVHLLNLLTIPAIAFVFYFKKFKPNVKGFIVTILISLLIVAMIMWGIIPGVAVIASKLEIFTVNSMGLFYNSGLFLWSILTLGALVLSIYFTHKSSNPILNYIFPSLSLILIGAPFMSDSIFINILLTAVMVAGVVYLARKKKPLLNLIMLAFTMIIIGYSSYAMIVIRSNANPPMDQNNPDDPFSLLYYLNREQYGDRPLMYGEYFDAEYERDASGAMIYSDSTPIYVKRDGQYVVVDQRRTPKFKEEDCTLFPRMYSSQPDHIEVYKEFGKFKASQTEPEFSNNINYFVSYQLNWMYWRYFMWNFAGRQNDIQGQGNLIHGNWISGFSFLDNPRLGDQSKLPDYLKNNKANNRYYMLPLLLGLIGLGYQLFKNLKDWWIVSLLFLLTGLAIVVYLNQYPNQPRERDYAYAGSFYAFAIWIGLGVVGIYQLLRKFSPAVIAGSVATLICAPIPYIMAKQNWNDHDRSNRFIARDFAYNYLTSCAPNAILFTYGDNDTFPIWYAQEVERVRPDVKVCCLPYFASDWYIDQMKHASYKAAPMPLSFERASYEPSVRDILYYAPEEEKETSFISISGLLDYILDSEKSTRDYDGETIFTYHKNKLYMDIDTLKVVKNKTVKPSDSGKIDSVIYFDLNRNYLVKNEMMTLDLLRTNNWDRPIYFTNIGGANTLGLNNYFQNEGFAYRLVPIRSDRRGRIDVEIMYDNLMNKFRWGNMNDPNIIIDNTINNTMRVVKVRDNFKELALLLAKEGDLTRAKKVIARCDELMPVSMYPPQIQDIDYVRAYYAAGEQEKGDNYLRAIAKNTIQELDFFASLDTNQRKRCTYEIHYSLQTLLYIIAYTADPADKELYDANFQEVVPITYLYNREKIFSELLPKLKNYSRVFANDE